MTSTWVSGHADSLESDAPIVAFAGRIASGKSGLARALADHLGVPRASFAEYIRSRARESEQLSTKPPRVVLQELGEVLASEPAQFCEMVLASTEGWQPGQPLVIDGVRHVKIWQALRERFQSSGAFLVYVDSGDARRESLLRVEGNSADTINRLDAHSTEHDVRWELAAIADVVLDDAPPEAMLGELRTWLMDIWPDHDALIERQPSRVEDIRKYFRAITSDELVRNDPTGEADPKRWHDEGRILAFLDPTSGTLQYPEFQFTYDAQPYPVLAKLIRVCRMAGIGDDSLFAWLVERNVHLDFVAPADELKRSDDILFAADSFMGGFAGKREYTLNRESGSPRTAHILQQWSGVVLETDADAYLARLRKQGSDEEALRWFDQGEIGSHRRLALGSTFSWSQLPVTGRPGANLWVVDVDDDLDLNQDLDAEHVQSVLASIDRAVVALDDQRG